MNHSEILSKLDKLLKQIKKEKYTGPIVFKMAANQGGIRNTDIFKIQEKRVILEDQSDR